MIVRNPPVYCTSCKGEIPPEECVEVYGDIWLPAAPYADFELYFHDSCLPPVFYEMAQKILGNA